MEALKPEELKFAKSKGFLRNRGTNLFSGRVVSPGGVYTAEHLELIAECARRYGVGRVAFTSRLSAEIVGIPYENIEAACHFLERANSGLSFGGTGARIRPITACKGTTCVFGCCDTQGLAKELHRQFYLGWSDVVLPHKFKIAVGGCPNSCMKPSLNDFGVEACRQNTGVRFRVYVGGAWGRKTRVGTPLSRQVEQGALIPLLDRVLQWYRENGAAGERLGAVVDRIGIQALEAFLGWN